MNSAPAASIHRASRPLVQALAPQIIKVLKDNWREVAVALPDAPTLNEADSCGDICMGASTRAGDCIHEVDDAFTKSVQVAASRVTTTNTGDVHNRCMGNTSNLSYACHCTLKAAGYATWCASGDITPITFMTCTDTNG
jgi:hypothetical protein